MELDKIDEKILKNLMVDARLSARQLALKLGMSTVTILSRMKKACYIHWAVLVRARKTRF